MSRKCRKEIAYALLGNTKLETELRAKSLFLVPPYQV